MGPAFWQTPLFFKKQSFRALASTGTICSQYSRFPGTCAQGLLKCRVFSLLWVSLYIYIYVYIYIYLCIHIYIYMSYVSIYIYIYIYHTFL